MVLFTCVVLHEYGHALAARRYGIVTRDIILSPIGGIARLEYLPDRPLHEIFIAVAGPLVNIAIAALLSLILFVVLGEPLLPQQLTDDIMRPLEFMRAVIGINIILFVFNLIPAFPMDGGRVLRALLAMRWGRAKGTKYAAAVGKVLAVGFIAYAVYGNDITLGLVGVFIYTMAGMENKQVQLRYALEGATAATIMRQTWTHIHIGEQMRVVVDHYLHGVQKSFLVYDSQGYICGCLPELVIKECIKAADHDATVNQYMSQMIGYVMLTAPLSTVYEAISQQDYAVIVVRDADTQDDLGLIDRDSLRTYIEAKKS